MIKPSEDGAGQRKSFPGKRRNDRPSTIELDYKNPHTFRSYLTERFKIVPRRITGLTAGEQRVLTREVKRARHLALIPYTSTQLESRDDR